MEVGFTLQVDIPEKVDLCRVNTIKSTVFELCSLLKELEHLAEDGDEE